jgi:hypothetical protein
MRKETATLNAGINLGAFDGKPKLLRAVGDLQRTLDELGLSQDREMTYQLNFLFCDRVTIDQIACIGEIIRLALKRQPQGMPSA